MINRQFLYSTACAVVVMGACVYVSPASAQTTYDGGSVMVYDLQGPPPTVMAQPMPQPVQTYPVAAPAYDIPAPVAPSYTPRAVSVMDTSYAPGSLYIVGSAAKESSSPVIATPISAAAINAPAPVVIPAPVAYAPPKPARTAMDMIAEAKQSTMAPIVDGDMGGAAPVPAPAPALQNAVAPQPVPAPMMSVANAPMMSSVSGTRSAGNCAVNESLVQKITLLEREKESIRKQAFGLGGMESIARCATETQKIQGLEAQLAYLREENESLKRLNNEHFATQAAMATSPISSPATQAVEEAPIEVPPAEQPGL